jgi:hypothetical protein
MGLAASKSWISQGISCGNTDESPILRGRETVLEAFDINCKDMRMLSVRTGDKLRAILGRRAGYIERCKSGSEGAVIRSPETWSDPRGWEPKVQCEPLRT